MSPVPQRMVPPRLFVALCVVVAVLFLAWNLIAIVGGWVPGYLRVALDGAVLVVLLTKWRYARIYIKVWSLLPIISMGFYLVSSALRAKWSAMPIQHVVGLLLAVPIFLWVDKAYRTSGDI